MFVVFEKSHRNGGTKVRYLEGGPFGPVFDSMLESVQKISLIMREMNILLDCFSISFLTKEIVPKSNINRSKSEN